MQRLKYWTRQLLSYAKVRPAKRFPYIGRVYPYHPPKGPSRNLSSDFFSPSTLTATDALPDDTPEELYSIWCQIPKGHKWLHYFKTYECISATLRKRPIRMLEIGVEKGSSIHMWRRYLHQDSIIVGLDIDPSCKAYESEEDKLYVRIGDQSDKEVLRGIVREFGPFDVIVDDGSHVCSQMIASFNYLFLSGLNSPGVYLVEDTHSNYWQSHRDQEYSFVDLCKDLVDFMHCHYFESQSIQFFRKDGPRRLESLSVPRLCSEIEEIQFRDSLIVIQKKTKSCPPTVVRL